MQKLNLTSQRVFAVVFIEENFTYSNPATKLTDILSADNLNGGKGDWEYNYAMQDNIDAILDLKPGERLAMKFNRDNPDSEGFIKRIS